MIVFIPAAGLGTRLRPLTDDKPKALVSYRGKPLLVHLLERLQALGYREFVLNLHHFADMLADFAASYAEEHGLTVRFSDESRKLLDTGGALTHAFPLLSGHEYILVHNVDIMSDLDPEFLEKEAELRQAEAVLSVRERSSSRVLYAGPENRLWAWQNLNTGQCKGRPIVPGMQAYAFSGIHLIRKSLIERWVESYGTDRPFSVIDAYIGSSERGAVYLRPEQGGYWKDMGKIADFGD